MIMPQSIQAYWICISHKNPLSTDNTHAPVNYFYNKQKTKLYFFLSCVVVATVAGFG